MFTFIELPAFSRYREDYFTEGSFLDLQQYLNHNPEAGDLIPSAGGVRKLRWMRAGMGKRGGLRKALREVAENAEIA